MKYLVTRPRTAREFERYFHFRYEVLRRPWHQKLGSEQDELEGKSVHVMAVLGGEPIACGRLHFNSPDEAQFRYMGVRKDYRRKGVGKAVLTRLEVEARTRGAHFAWFNAREGAVMFYEKCGYSILEQSYLLWDVLPHWKMFKEL